VAITFFNWHELLLKGRKDPTAIIILAYAQTRLYNESSSKKLLHKLNLHHIPLFMVSSRLLIQQKSSLLCTYRTQEPQSYFKNPYFLTANISIKQRLQYLKALSMRRISEQQDCIPKSYMNLTDHNPFMQVKDNYIYFTYESSKLRNT
jgi:hypothetical protein